MAKNKRIRRSSAEELAASQRQVQEVIDKIRGLKAAGWRVHLIFDFDGVLAALRDEDIFQTLGCNPAAYCSVQERLFRQLPEDGPWAVLADHCGDPGFHDTQDIVTARSGLAPLRVYAWTMARRLKVRPGWMHYLGYQPKGGSYGIIFHSLQAETRTFFIVVDDSLRHVESFRKAAAEWNVADRSEAILAKTVRTYDESDVRREIELVLNYAGETEGLLTVHPPRGRNPGRTIRVDPNPLEGIRAMFMAAVDGGKNEA